jgi:hypothetical protein
MRGGEDAGEVGGPAGPEVSPCGEKKIEKMKKNN